MFEANPFRNPPLAISAGLHPLTGPGIVKALDRSASISGSDGLHPLAARAAMPARASTSAAPGCQLSDRDRGAGAAAGESLSRLIHPFMLRNDVLVSCPGRKP